MNNAHTLRLMNGVLKDGQLATVYTPIDGAEIRALGGNTLGTLWVKLPGADAGTREVDPARTYIISIDSL